MYTEEQKAKREYDRLHDGIANICAVITLAQQEGREDIIEPLRQFMDEIDAKKTAARSRMWDLHRQSNQ